MNTTIQKLILCTLLFFGINHLAFNQELPHKIIIRDSSNNSSYNWIYHYEFKLDKNRYKVYQTFLEETNPKEPNKQSKKKFLHKIPTQLIANLLEELEHPKEDFSMEDLGYSHQWFLENQEQIFDMFRASYEKNLCNNHEEWNSHQINEVKKQLKDSSAIKETIRQRFFRTTTNTTPLKKNYLTTTNTTPLKWNTPSLEIELHFKDEVVAFQANNYYNYMRLPWINDQDEQLYNIKLSSIVQQLIPKNKGLNKSTLVSGEQEQILKTILAEFYYSFCRQKISLLTHHNYTTEIKELRSKFVLRKFQDQCTSTTNWDGNRRLFIHAKDTLVKEEIYFRISLSIGGETLFTRDSVLKKADYHYQHVIQIPFLLEYLEKNPKRSLGIVFDNDNSLSKYVKMCQSRRLGSSNVACLKDAKEDYLNQGTMLVLKDENDYLSNWIITPELDVILTHYQNPKVYKYTDKDLGMEASHIRYLCQHFKLNGDLKE